MDEQEKRLIAGRLAELTEQIVLRVKPFDTLHWPSEVTYQPMAKFHLYSEEIEPPMKESILQYCRNYPTYFHLQHFGLATGPTFCTMYPDLCEALVRFTSWYGKREETSLMPYITGYSDIYPSFDVNELIKETITKRAPEYKVAKKKPFCGARAFCKPLGNDNKLFIGFERTSLRSFMSFFVGFEKPWFGFDIGNLFLKGQSHFDFVYSSEYIGPINGEKRRVIERLEPNPNNVVEVTDTALDLLDQLLPHLLHKLGVTPGGQPTTGL
jgi:hypothetical protein